MICEEAICNLCIYVTKNADGIQACDKDPPNELRNGIAASQGYCRYFTCKYAKEGLCKKKL